MNTRASDSLTTKEDYALEKPSEAQFACKLDVGVIHGDCPSVHHPRIV